MSSSLLDISFPEKAQGPLFPLGPLAEQEGSRISLHCPDESNVRGAAAPVSEMPLVLPPLLPLPCLSSNLLMFAETLPAQSSL